ncbi:MAG: ABC transporter permease [Anaerolineaceae bacterium]|nr:MAG: ABC transporter permease [Anaerolineaceae bacterium]
MNTNIRQSLRIIWAITAKDIVDGLKNKTTLSTILTTLFVAAIYKFLPMLDSGGALPNLIVYDQGGSSIVAMLEESTEFNLVEFSSRERMERFLTEEDTPALALVIPPDLDQELTGSATPEVEGYILHWVSESDAEELKTVYEGEISEIVGHPIRIHIEGNIVYTEPDSLGLAFLVSLALVIVITMIGISFTVNLMFEEKQTKAIDALLVSPASSGQVVMAKFLTGLLYCLLGAVVVLALNSSIITHWWLVILGVIVGSFFTVGLGILLGSIFEVRQQVMLWGFMIFIPLLLPLFLPIMSAILPKTLIDIFSWIPTVALDKVFRVSFSAQAPLSQFGPQLLLVACCAVLVFALVVRVLRRSDR